MDELKMIAELLPAPEPPAAEAVQSAYDRLAAVTMAATVPGRSPGRRADWPRTRKVRTAGWLAGGFAVLAAAAAFAVLAASASPGTGPAGPSGGSNLAARTVLLAAARQINGSHATGAFWVVRLLDDQLYPGGTKAHPYDLFLRRGFSTWESVAPHGRDIYTSQYLTARLATAADAAAWRAAGHPSQWVIPAGWPGRWSLTKPVPGGAYTGSGKGQKVCVLGDGHLNQIALTAAQCLRLPQTAAGLRAVLRPYAEQYVRGTPVGSTGLTEAEWIANGAYQILTDPVRPQTEAAALRLLAEYPGTALVATVRDPLGRAGYALALRFRDHAVVEFIISRATGQLLATRRVFTSPTGWVRQSWYYLGSTYHPGLYGRPWYPGMVAEWNIFTELGWSNTAPRG
jgi:hypothetical protein